MKNSWWKKMGSKFYVKPVIEVKPIPVQVVKLTRGLSIEYYIDNEWTTFINSSKELQFDTQRCIHKTPDYTIEKIVINLDYPVYTASRGSCVTEGTHILAKYLWDKYEENN